MEYDELIKSIENKSIKGQFILTIEEKEIKVSEVDLIKQYITGVNQCIQDSSGWVYSCHVIGYVLFIWFINAQTFFQNNFIEMFQGWGAALGLFVIGFFSATLFADISNKKKAKSLNSEFMHKAKELGFTKEYLLNQQWLTESCPDLKALLINNHLTTDASLNRWK